MKSVLSLVVLALTAVVVAAQDLIVAKQGDPIKVWNMEISDKYVFYTTEPDEGAQIQRLAKDDILMIRRADGSTVSLTNTQAAAAPQTPSAAPEPDFPTIDERDIHGSLIAQGNCVYIPTDSPLEYEAAGQKRLKEYMQKWGYWQVVPKLEQAHFVLQYTTQTSGSDVSFIIIRPRKYYTAFPTLVRDGIWTGRFNEAKGHVGIVASWAYSNEDVGDNIINAESMANKIKLIVLDPSSKEGKSFFKYNGEALDADSSNNNSRGY